MGTVWGEVAGPVFGDGVCVIVGLPQGTLLKSLNPCWLLRFLLLLQKRGKDPEKIPPNWGLLTSGTWGCGRAGTEGIPGAYKEQLCEEQLPGLQELAGVTPNNGVRHRKPTEEMRPPLGSAAGWPGAVLASPAWPCPPPALAHTPAPKVAPAEHLGHRSCRFTHWVGCAGCCHGMLCPKSPHHHLKFHGPLL